MAFLTVFTPTRNQADLLPRCYQSLCRQTDTDFIWMIVDDDSKDETADIVKSWIGENKLHIHYIRQGYQGMHNAHNTAYRKIRTELNVCLNASDWFDQKAVEKIRKHWGKFKTFGVAGIIALNADENGQVIGTKLPQGVATSRVIDLYEQHGVTGDKKLVYRTDLTRKYPYPQFQGESYTDLAYKYFKLDEGYTMLLMNEKLTYSMGQGEEGEYLKYKHYKTNPQSYSFYHKELMMLSRAKDTFRFRQAVHYVSSSMFEKNGRFLQETPKRGMTLAAFPFGVVLYLMIQIKT